MKFNFKKITAIGASALLTGMTMGVAAAANFPAPFVVGGTANVAIVYGTGTGVSQLDAIQAGNIQTSLQSYMGGTTTTTSSVSGESVLFESGTNKLNINNNLTDIKTVALDGDDLPTILKSGTYSNKDNSDFDYDQKVEINADVQFAHFADNEYLNKAPTLGIRIAKGKYVLNYSLDFVKDAEDDTNSGDDFNKFEDTTIEMLGKTYEITTVTNTSNVVKFTMMAGVDKGTLSYLETGTYDVDGTSYEVTLVYVDSDECKFNVNGVDTDKLTDGATDKLSDGETLIGVTEVDYSVGATTEIMKCEFFIGANKLELEHNKEVEIDDVAVRKLKTFFHDTAGQPYKLDKIVLEWKANDDLFVAGDNEVIMPGFESIKLTSGGLIAPTGELIKVRGSSNEEVELIVPIESGTATIQLLGSNESGGFNKTGGGNDGEGLPTINGTGASVGIIYNLTSDAGGDQYFVATYLSGADGSSYLVEISDSDDANGVDFRDVVSGTALATDKKNDSTFTIGDASFKLEYFIEDQWAVINATGSNTYFDRVVSKEGMVIYLPVENQTATEDPVRSPFIGNLTSIGDVNPTTYILWMEEEDKDGNLGGGTTTGSGEDINITLGHTASTNGYNTEATFSSTADNVCSGGVDLEDPDNNNYYICYTASDLGTKVEYDSDPDEDTVDITYYGTQIYGQIYLAEVGAEVTAAAVATTGATQLGDVLVKDNEVSSVSSKNLVIVGGSCINSAAATALGVSQGTCGAAFTTATGVGSGEFLIKGVDGAFSTGKIALVVAGYEVADTVNAATYLRNQVVDTSKEYKGTSSTSATMVTTEA